MPISTPNGSTDVFQQPQCEQSPRSVATAQKLAGQQVHTLTYPMTGDRELDFITGCLQLAADVCITPEQRIVALEYLLNRERLEVKLLSEQKAGLGGLKTLDALRDELSKKSLVSWGNIGGESSQISAGGPFPGWAGDKITH